MTGQETADLLGKHLASSFRGACVDSQHSEFELQGLEASRGEIWMAAVTFMEGRGYGFHTCRASKREDWLGGYFTRGKEGAERLVHLHLTYSGNSDSATLLGTLVEE